MTLLFFASAYAPDLWPKANLPMISHTFSHTFLHLFLLKDLKLVGTGQSKTNALIVENKPKNRYNNVLPCE